MSRTIKGIIGLLLIILSAFLAANFLSEDAPEQQDVVTYNESSAAKQEEFKKQTKITKAIRPKVNREFKNGTDYRTLETVVDTDVGPEQIEVISIFWYGCPHCYSLESIVSRWHKTLPAHVSFVSMPGFFGPNLWRTHAQLYYTVLNMGIIDKVNIGIFNEIQNQRNMLQDSSEMAEFLSLRYGVNKKTFTNQFNSFGVNVQLQQAFSRLKGYELTGVPAIIIDGRYVVEPGLAESLDNMVVIADFLINKVEKERSVDVSKL